MSAVLDPRQLGADRIYQYGEYQALAARYRRRKTQAWYQDFFSLLTGKRHRTSRAVRLLPFKLALGIGALTLIGSLCSFSLLSADSMRLAYAKQDMQNGLAGLDQAVSEATEQNAAGQTQVLTDKTGENKVVYPADTNFVVLTNIDNVGGERLVEELYPLSKRIIQVEP
jgi:hypothetical protein